MSARSSVLELVGNALDVGAELGAGLIGGTADLFAQLHAEFLGGALDVGAELGAHLVQVGAQLGVHGSDSRGARFAAQVYRPLDIARDFAYRDA